ncbi:hypothetical protein CYG68_03805 [Morganella morganii]|uniref:Putative tail fiber protein gp53-like C-terminal domain-containing protein n=1 Tax=Morganella morganii TaxID=582 RepID=A0A8I0PZ15_MORMO|nr:phage tail protein [Morganella morganii]MBE8611540.1 hypothetical protein [Morganella morganii]
MGNLTEREQWEEDIYQLETSDPVLGGPEGIANKASRQLANRTRWLKKKQEAAQQALAAHAQSRDHPDGTVRAKGLVQLCSATNSLSEGLAATPKAVKAAYDLASGKYTAQDAGTTQKGLVQLDSSTTSSAENKAATPKAVKAVMDVVRQKAAINSPAFTGAPTAPTPADSANGQQIATAAFVLSRVAKLVNASPAALDTLKELAGALGNDPNFSTTISNLIGQKLAKNQNGADIPDKGRFRAAINAVSQTDFDRQMRTKGNKNTANKAVNGWWKCGDTGLLIQWGMAPYSRLGTITVSLPVPFPTVGFMAMGTGYEAFNYENDEVTGSVKLLNASQLRVTLDNVVPTVWFAIGH